MNLNKIYLALVCASILVMLNGCEGKEERRAKYLEKGRAYIEEENYEKARIELSNVLQIDPKYAEAYLLMGNIEEKNKNWTKAFGNYNKAVELDPENIAARVRVGLFNIALHKLDKATEQMEEVIKRDPDYIEGRLLKARILYKKDKFDDAIHELTSLLDSDMHNVEAIELLVIIYKKKENTDTAIKVLKRGVSDNSDNTLLRVLLSQIYVANKDLVLAENLLLEAVSLSSDHRTVLIDFYQSTEQSEKAEKLLRDMIQEDPGDVVRYARLVEFLVKENRIDEAESELTSALQSYPNGTQLRTLLARLYEHAGKKDAAIQLYREGIDIAGIDPDGLTFRGLMAGLLFEKGQYKKVKELIGEVLAENPRDNAVLMIKGRLAMLKGDMITAINSFRSVFKDQSDSAEVIGYLVNAHLKNNEPGLAEEILLRSLEVNIGSKQEKIKRVQMLSRLKGSNEAIEELHKLFGEELEDIDVLQLKANLLAGLRDFVGMKKTLLDIKNQYPDNPVGYRLLGRYYLEQKEYGKALDEFRYDNDRFADAATFINNAVTIYIEQGKHDQALDYVKGRFKDVEVSPVAQGLMAQIFLSDKDYDKAEKSLRKIISLNPEGIEAYRRLIGIYMDRDDDPAAVKVALEGLQAVPDKVQFDFLLASVYEKSNMHEKANQVYRGVIDEHGTDKKGLEARKMLALLSINQQKPDEAKRLIEEILVEFPNDTTALLTKGKLALSTGEGQAAIDAFQSVLTQRVKSADIFLLLAKAYLLTGQHDLAQETMQKGIEVNPDDVKAHLNYVVYLKKTGSYKQAMEEVQRTLAIARDNINALKIKIELFAAMKDRQNLIEAVSYLKKTHQDDAYGYYYMGEVFLSEKKYTDAVKEFEGAIKRSPGSLETYAGLLKAYMVQNQHEKAISRMNILIEQNPDNSMAYNLLGEVHFAQKKIAESEKAFRKAIVLDPQLLVSYTNLANLYVAQDDYTAAIKMYKDAIKNITRSDQLMIPLAETYRKAGKIDEAIRSYQNFLDNHSSDKQRTDISSNNLASILVEHKSDNASLKRALKLAKRFESSENPFFLDTLGWVYLKNGEKEHAIAALNKVVKIAPEKPVFQYHLGMAYYQANDKVAAKNHLNNAVTSKDEFAEREHAEKILDQLQ